MYFCGLELLINPLLMSYAYALLIRIYSDMTAAEYISFYFNKLTSEQALPSF